MKKIYESFEEMAEDMKNGNFLAHQLSDHSTEICDIWQQSILEFGKALDNAGIPLPKDEEIYERFWEKMGEALIEWKAGTNRRKPYSKKLGDMTVAEAKARYGGKYKAGSKLIIPRYEENEISQDYYMIIP